MHIVSKTIVALGFAGAMTCGGSTLTHAQGIYFGGPGVEFSVGRQPYRERSYSSEDRYSDGNRYRSEGSRSYDGGSYVYVRPEWNERRSRSGRDWD